MSCNNYWDGFLGPTALLSGHEQATVKHFLVKAILSIFFIWYLKLHHQMPTILSTSSAPGSTILPAIYLFFFWITNVSRIVFLSDESLNAIVCPWHRGKKGGQVIWERSSDVGCEMGSTNSALSHHWLCKVTAETCFAWADINAQPGYTPGMQGWIHPLSSCVLGACLKEKVVLYSLGISEEDPAATMGCWYLKWMSLTTPHLTTPYQPSLCLCIQDTEVIHHPERDILLLGSVSKSFRI